MYWGQRLMYWCVSSPAKVVNDTVNSIREGNSDKLKSLLLNQGTVPELLCAVHKGLPLQDIVD